MMSEELKIALTAVAGVSVFVVGQILQKVFIEPIQEQRRLIGDIVHSIHFYANLFIYANYFGAAVKIRRTRATEIKAGEADLLEEAYKFTKEKSGSGTDKLRSLSAQIHQSIQVIPCYRILERLRIVYKSKILYEVAQDLVNLSNTSEPETAISCQNSIIQLLNVRHIIRIAKDEGRA